MVLGECDTKGQKERNICMAVDVGESIWGWGGSPPRWLDSQKSLPEVANNKERKSCTAKDRSTQRRWISGESSKECKIFKVVWRKLE